MSAPRHEFQSGEGVKREEEVSISPCLAPTSDLSPKSEQDGVSHRLLNPALGWGRREDKKSSLDEQKGDTEICKCLANLAMGQ